MTAYLDTTSSPSVDVLHIVVLVLVDVVFGRLRDVSLSFSYDLLRVETSCDVSDWTPDDVSCSRSRAVAVDGPENMKP